LLSALPLAALVIRVVVSAALLRPADAAPAGTDSAASWIERRLVAPDGRAARFLAGSSVLIGRC
jgi:hypothetical protein